jgi:hypothetical protein
VNTLIHRLTHPLSGLRPSIEVAQWVLSWEDIKRDAAVSISSNGAQRQAASDHDYGRGKYQQNKGGEPND